MAALNSLEKLNSLVTSLPKAEKIKLLALDVDGVLTDGGLYIAEGGEACKRFNVQDGLAMSCALRNHLAIAIITGRQSGIVLRRAAEIGITEVYQGVKDKKEMLKNLADKHSLSLAEVAYMGDDLNDLSALSIAGLACAPANAACEVKERVHLVAAKEGGDGAVREVIEVIFKARGEWERIVAAYIKNGQGDSQ